MSGKFLNYFVTNQFSNMIRVISYLLFYIGLILRFAKQNSEQEFVSAKIVLAYDLEIWFIRLLAFLGVAQNMGPKLVMIRKMVCHLNMSFHQRNLFCLLLLRLPIYFSLHLSFLRQ